MHRARARDAIAIAIAIVAVFTVKTVSLAMCRQVDGEAGIVARILDGDTLELDGGLRVRLAGVMAPKRPLDVADDVAWPSADAAAAALAGLALGQPAILRYAGNARRDRYGRALADVVVAPEGRAQMSLTDAMIRAGWLRVMPGTADPDCVATLMGLERDAANSGLGLWHDPYYAIRAADDPTLADETGLYDLVEGRVLSVGIRGTFVYLDFGRDWSTDFTAVLLPAARDALAAKGIRAESLRGRRVRVRGWMEQRGGPSLRISAPDQLELEPEGDPVSTRTAE